MRLLFAPFHLDKDTHEALPFLARRVATMLGIQTGIHAFPVDARLGFDSFRDQYQSGILIQHLNSFGGEDWILGVTGVDLFIPIFTFVLGEAQLGGKTGLVSSFRLKNSTYGLPDDADVLKERLLKVTLHEISHMLGFLHCLNSNCVMHAASSVEEVDLRSHEYCSACEEEFKPRLEQVSRNSPESYYGTGHQK